MSDKDLLSTIDGLLKSGLPTDWQHRAYESADVAATCQRLRSLDADDLAGHLKVTGFMLQPYVAPEDADGIAQSCATCMYFERHRGFCALPELMLPVEPEWSCVLWRI